MALADYALTTVTNARLYVKRLASASENDDLLELYINAYSKAIALYTEREFKPAANGTTRVIRYDGSGYLSLAPYELRAVTSVTLYSDRAESDWDVLDPQSSTAESEFRLEPRSGTTEGTFLWLSLPVLNGVYSRRARGEQVTVVGDWGVDDVPSDVELACLIAVANGYRNPAAFASQSLGDHSFTDEGDSLGGSPNSLPSDSRALLTPYRRAIY